MAQTAFNEELPKRKVARRLDYSAALTPHVNSLAIVPFQPFLLKEVILFLIDTQEAQMTVQGCSTRGSMQNEVLVPLRIDSESNDFSQLDGADRHFGRARTGQ